MATMKAPQKGKKPEKVKTAPPGGKFAPGNRGGKSIAEIAAETVQERDQGTSRSR